MCDEFDSLWKCFWGIVEVKYCKLKEFIFFGYESCFIFVFKINFNLLVCGVSIYFLNLEVICYYVEIFFDEWKWIGVFNCYFVECLIVKYYCIELFFFYN